MTEPQAATPRAAVRRLAGGVSVLLVALATAGALRLLALPFIVHAVSPDVYGTYVSLWVVLALMHGVSDLGLGAAAVRLAPECKTAADRRSLFATALSARAVVALVVTAAVVVTHEAVARWLTGSTENAGALLWLLLIAPFAILIDGLNDELRSRDAMATIGGLRVLWAALIQGASIAFVVWLGLGLRGLVWARGLGELIVFGTALALCFRFVRGMPSLSRLGPLLAFGWPLGFLYLLSMLRVLDRPLIRSLTSIEHVAAYDLAMRLVAPIGLVNIALGMVLEPFIYGQAASRSTPRFVDLFLRVYVTLFATIAMALATLGHELMTVFAPSAYHQAIVVLPALAFAATCEGVLRIAGIGASLAKQTRVWAVASLVNLGIGFPLAYALIGWQGFAASGLAWVASAAAAAVITYVVARRLSGITLPFARALCVVLAGSALGSAAVWQSWSLGLRVSVLFAFAIGVWRIMGVRVRDVRSLL